MTSLLVLVVIVAGFWAIGLVVHPWRHCTRCNNVPRTYRGGGSAAFRICGKCGGTGRQLRWGAGRFRWGA